MPRYRRFPAIALALAALMLRAAPASAADGDLREYERGMWVWQFDTYTTEKARQELIDFCKQEKINRLLVQFHYRVDPGNGQPVSILDSEAFGALIEQARSEGILVEALEGDPYWSVASGQRTFWPKLEIILDWNEKQPPSRKFVALHLDVEPYILKEFKTERRPQIMLEYLEYMSKVRERLRERAPGLLLAADIPFWYDVHDDEDDPENTVVAFNGEKKFLSEHLIDICDYVGVMAYRQFAVGVNSSTELCYEELAYAAKVGKKVFVAVDSSEAKGEDPPSITFFGTSAALMREQVELIEKTLRGTPGYGGVLVHDYKNYRKLTESPS